MGVCHILEEILTLSNDIDFIIYHPFYIASLCESYRSSKDKKDLRFEPIEENGDIC